MNLYATNIIRFKGSCYVSQVIKLCPIHAAYPSTTKLALHTTATKNVDSTSAYGNLLPVVAAESFLQNVHDCLPLPWWTTVTLTTIVFRGCITLPLAIYQQRKAAKLLLLQPRIKEISEAIKHNVTIKCKRENLSVDVANARYKELFLPMVKDLYKQEGCQPFKLMLLPWTQVPLWISISLALRNLSIYKQDPNMSTEGFAWFPNLLLPDSTWILPVIMGFNNLINITINTAGKQIPTRFQRFMRRFFITVSIFMVPIAAQLPSCISFYWMLSSLFSLLQNILLMLPRVKRLARIPQTPQESKHPFRDLSSRMKDSLDNFVQLQKTKNKKSV